MGGSNWSEPMGGSDADGNPITVSFGNGPNNNGTSREQYKGPGH